jgi:hypothetical protein
MAVRTRETPELEEQTVSPAPAVAPDGRSAAGVLALQASAGNAAVARAMAQQRMLARTIDVDALAVAIHTAVSGAATDEAAIFRALGQLNRDPNEVDRLTAAYHARFNEDLLTVLGGELDATGLQQARFLMRLQSSARMDTAAGELETMVGQQATWTGSGPGSGNTFEHWASAATEAAAPPVSAVTSINCWEMVILAAYRAGVLTWQWIHDRYTANVSNWGDYMVGMMSRGSRIPYVAGAPAGRKPLRGDIVFMDGMAHVAMATGNVDGAGRAEVISFWPPPNTPFTRGGTLDSVKVTTIEELSDWWTANMPPAPVVELAAPPWS